jgi:hypothetical protein
MSQSGWVSRWAAALLLLPLPLYFLIALARDAGPAWRAEYRGINEPPGVGVVSAERQLSLYWDKQNRSAPGGRDARSSAARFDACMLLETSLEIPFMLVANGIARFELDGEQKLSVDADEGRRASGAVLRLEPGMHHLRVDFSARDWPSIALNASLDGRAPTPLGSGELAPGVELSQPLPGDSACALPR